MKFIVSSALLVKNLQAISGVISPNNTLPILDDFLFDIGEETLTVTASDIEMTMSIKLPLTMSEDPGIVAIPAKILLETLKTLPDIPVTFNINKENFAVEMIAGEGKYKLSGHLGDEYPPPLRLKTVILLPLIHQPFRRPSQKLFLPPVLIYYEK